jgi:two-component system, OmpR family, response regulator RegX3
VTRVLIVEDEESFADPLAFLLRREGFTTAITATGPDALAEFDRNGADIVLLDVMLPGMSGTDVCKALRSRSAVPVIMVTARDSEIDKVVGLELGADDYVTKPFDHLELLARVKALLRRLDMPQPVSRAPSFRAGDLTVDFASREVRREGELVPLTATEYKVLYHLVRNAGRVLPHETLLAKV